MANAKFKEEQRQEVIRLHKSRYTYLEISQKTGISQSSVYQIIKKYKENPYKLQLDSADEDSAAETEEEAEPIIGCGAEWKKIYDRIRELVTEKQKIEDELWNLRATLMNGIDIINGKEDV